MVEVYLTGEFDLSTSAELSEILFDVFTWRPKRVVVDLVAVAFLDVSTLHVIADACTAVRGIGAAFSVCCVRGMTRRLLEILDLVEHLDVLVESP